LRKKERKEGRWTDRRKKKKDDEGASHNGEDLN